MKFIKIGSLLLLVAAMLAGCQQAQEPASEAIATEESAASTASSFQVPVQYHTLDNGLKVVMSQDKTTPIVTVAVYYNIGFRIEPQERTGFAHLF